jgi:hypothetical protein
MKKAAPLLLALIGLLAGSQSVMATPQGVVQGGYDESTAALEGGFKIMAIKRVFSEDECYPRPNEMATILTRDLHRDVVVSPTLNSVQGEDLINVIANQTNCDRLVLALRSSGPKQHIFVLDSDYGPVYLAGQQNKAGKSQPGGGGPLRNLTSASKEFRMSDPDGTSRLEVLCPNGSHPLGGGFYNATPLGNDGEGIYSHSYERLGAQDGFHDTVTFVSPSQKPRERRVVLQVVCGQGLVPTASPHATTYVHRHETASVTAHCPKGTQIFSGGFQRTNFTTPGVKRYGGHIYGGDYITESRADGTDGWTVSGGATGENGGELTAIAYCADDSSLPIKEVSAEVSVGEKKAASATTPPCPDGYALISGGFSFGGSHDALFADGYFTRGGRWAATGYGWFGQANLTAYGYCAKARDNLDRSDFPLPPPQGPAPSDSGGKTWLYVGIGVLAIALLLFLRRRQVVRRRARRRRSSAR